jgi:hypothetical protein
MKRQLAILACSTFLAVPAVPAFAAAPFGGFDRTVAGHQISGRKPLHGWALDDDGIESVDIYVDGDAVGRADYGRARPGVVEHFPGYPDTAAAGWAFNLDTTQFLNKSHRITVRLRSKTGEVTWLEGQTAQFVNTDHNLHPFGQIDFPSRHAELRGNCNLADPNRRYSVVSGWMLDAAVTPEDAGVGYIELLIDGAIIFNTKIDCAFSAATGGLTNCYGLRRFGVEDRFGELVDSPHSGFRFVLDVGLLMAVGYTPGSHVLSVRAGDKFTQDVTADQQVVTFSCDEDLGNENALGRVGEPRNGRMFHDTISVVGWALDWEGIAQIQVLVDGTVVGVTFPTLLREQITLRYPGYPNSAFPGFSFALDTTAFSDGQHHIQVVVVDFLGGTTVIGERTVTFVNDGTDCSPDCV